MAGLGSHPVQTLLAAFLTAHQPAQRGTRPDWEPGNTSLQSGTAKKKKKVIKLSMSVKFMEYYYFCLIPLIYCKVLN